MTRRTALAIALVFLPSLAGPSPRSARAEAPEPGRMTDLIPQKAVGSIFFRSVNELRADGDRLFQKTGWPFPPSMLLRWVGQELKVQGTVDGDQPCGVLWFEPDDTIDRPGQFRLPPAAAVFTIRDIDQLAERIGTTVDELKSGRTVQSDGQQLYPTRFYRLVDDQLWIATEERLFVELSNRMPLNFVIARPRRERMRNADILLSFRPTARIADREARLRSQQEWIDRHPELGVEERATLQELLSLFEAMSNVVIGVRVHEDGIEVDGDVYFDFRQRRRVQTVLRRFNPTGASSSLSRLPDGNVLFSHALQADGKATLPALNVMLTGVDIIHSWQPFDRLKVLSDVQQLKLMGLFGEVWRQIDGYQMAACQPSDPSQYGAVGIVAVLQTANPQQIIADIQELAGFIDGSRFFVQEPAATGTDGEKHDRLSLEGRRRVERLVEQLGDEDYATRQSATVRLSLLGEPVRPFVTPLAEQQADPPAAASLHARRVVSLLEAARKKSTSKPASPRVLSGSDMRFSFRTEDDAVSGRTLHIIEMSHRADTPAQTDLHRQMQSLLGVEWNQLRLVPGEGRLLVLLGSDPRLRRRAIDSSESDAENLQTATAARVFGDPLNPGRGAEFHIDLDRFRQLLNHQARHRPQASQNPGDRPPPSNTPEPESPAAAPESPPADADGDRGPDTNSQSITSLAFTIRDEYVCVEWRFPVADILALEKLR